VGSVRGRRAPHSCTIVSVGNLLHASHTVHEAKYHMVWSMKYRKKLLYNKRYQEKLRELLEGIAERYWYAIHKMATDGDHIHLFIQAAPDDSIATIVKTIKSITAREMYQVFPELKKLMWGTKLWEQGYFVRTVGDETTSEAIKRYIEMQGRQRGVKAEQLTFINQ